MATYRSIYTTFWTDTKVSDDFTPEDKYFMLYCLTNNFTNLCGCYEISIKQISRDTGYNEETVLRLLDRFNNVHNIISYNKDNKEMLIRNWYKYNWTKSNKLDKPLLNEIKSIKTLEFKKIIADEYNKRDTVSIPYVYHMDTSVLYCTVSDTVSDTDKERKNINITKCYEENIGMITPAVAEILYSYVDEGLSEELVCRAIKIATLNNKRSMNYINGILKSWKNKGYKVLADIREEQKRSKEETDEEKIQRKIRELEEAMSVEY